MDALFYTAAELAARGSGSIPRELVSNTHLIYSSPAALAFNSPGAEGYGVKRAGLAVPGSVMLIVSPGCCGRNTSAISSLPGYEDRFFYLTMDQTDLVTGRHLKKIPGAVREICRGLEDSGKRPRVVMICITCVDALLGTDMERVCRRAQEQVPGVRVRPCYMYALTREGRRPPMVHVRQSIYELLQPRKKKASSVNLLGFFAPVEGAEPEESLPGRANGSAADSLSARKNGSAGESLPGRANGSAAESLPARTDGSAAEQGSEIYALLRQAGVRTIRQIGTCRDYEAFQCMAEANFNLILHPEARPAAYDLQERLGIPFIELRRFYQIDRIRAQYAALGKVLQTAFDDEKWEKEAEDAVRSFRALYPDAVFSIGEAMNGDPFELACALAREGFSVSEVFGTVTEENFVWIRILASLCPETRIYSNLHPSMLQYCPPEQTGNPSPVRAAGDTPQQTGTSSPVRAAGDIPKQTGTSSPVRGPGDTQEDRRETAASQNRISVPTITIGRDAGWYHPDLPNVQWNTDRQPFGYRAVTGLFNALKSALETGSRGTYASTVSLHGEAADQLPAKLPGKPQEDSPENMSEILREDSPEKMSGKLQDDSREKPSVKQQADPVQAVHSLQTPPPRGFRRFTTPFAPDQSGAVSVLYDMGGLCVVCDAGGCTGNICGFDEPRWFRSKSAVFSAGLRDMDAILGRDDLLVKKLAEAAGQIPADFAAIIGTPVPAVIGTDYRALCRMAEKKTGLPVLGIATNGMDYYDRGIEKTSLALLDSFCRRSGKHAKLHPADEDRKLKTGSAAEKKERIIGIWGYSPLDFAGILTGDSLRAWSRAQGYDTMICCGAGTDISLLRRIPEAEKNIVLSPAGTAPAQWLAKEYGIPWEYGVPDTKGLLSSLPGGKQLLSEAGERKEYSRGRKILVVHQQVLARRLADLLQKNGFQADAASFFLMHKDLLQPADMQLREETDLRKLVEERKYDIVIADRAMGQILAGLPVRLVHLPHFAVSGKAD